MEINGLKISAASEQQFLKSLELFPCSYHPASNLETGNNPDGSPFVILPLAAKRLWFFTYCKENGKVGKIIPECGNTQFNVCSLEGMSIGFVTAKASIYMDEALIGIGEAGQAFNACNMADLSNVIQSVTGLAQSKALTNAGFGSVDRLDIVPVENPPVTGGNAPGTGYPFIYSAASTPSSASNIPGVPPVGNAQSNPPAGNMPVPPPQHGYTGQPPQGNPVVGTPNTQKAFEMLGGKVDELTLAKRTPYPLRGQYSGKPLGELPTKSLEFLVNKLGGELTADVAAAQAAAKLILQDRQKTSGRAIP